MPTLTGLFPLPPVQVETGALAAAASYISPSAVAAIPDLNLRPRRRIAIERIYVPVVVNATNTAPASPVTSTVALVTGRVRGALLWQWQASIALVPIPGGGFSVANAAIADDLQNPLALDVHDQLELFVTLLHNQQVNDSFFGLGYYQATYQAAWQPRPGSVFYASQD